MQLFHKFKVSDLTRCISLILKTSTWGLLSMSHDIKYDPYPNKIALRNKR